MNKRQALTYGQTGQVVEFYPPEWVLGAVTGTPTYSIWEALDSNDDTAELSGNATVDSVSATVDQASGYSQTNRKRLYIDLTTGVTRGRPLILANGLTQREIVVPDGIASNDYLELDADLAYDYPVSVSTLKGWRLYFTIDSTWVQDESNINSARYPYRVRWSYTIDSVSYQRWTNLDLVRQQAKPSINVQDLLDSWPDLKGQDWIEQRGKGFQPQIDAAERRVDFDARLHGTDPNTLRDQQLYDGVLLSAVKLELAEAGICPGNRTIEPFIAERKKQYQDDFMQAIGVLKIPVDQGKEGAITDRPFVQPTFTR